jgi:hypothetical protein
VVGRFVCGFGNLGLFRCWLWSREYLIIIDGVTISAILAFSARMFFGGDRVAHSYRRYSKVYIHMCRMSIYLSINLRNVSSVRCSVSRRSLCFASLPFGRSCITKSRNMAPKRRRRASRRRRAAKKGGSKRRSRRRRTGVRCWIIGWDEEVLLG